MGHPHDRTPERAIRVYKQVDTGKWAASGSEPSWPEHHIICTAATREEVLEKLRNKMGESAVQRVIGWRT